MDKNEEIWSYNTHAQTHLFENINFPHFHYVIESTWVEYFNWRKCIRNDPNSTSSKYLKRRKNVYLYLFI